jgi:hypothetical protein
MVFSNKGIQDAEVTDDPTIRIGEERIGDAAFLRELGQRLLGVVADRVRLNTGVVQGFQILLQLHELRFAEPSPVSASMEEDQGLRLAIRCVSNGSSGLIGEFELGNLISYAWTFGEVFSFGICVGSVCYHLFPSDMTSYCRGRFDRHGAFGYR